jgi:hypothetical protein
LTELGAESPKIVIRVNPIIDITENLRAGIFYKRYTDIFSVLPMFGFFFEVIDVNLLLNGW